MRQLIFLGLLAVMAIPAGAARHGADARITVAQLDQALTAAQAKHKSDAVIVRMIGGMELSERLTDATLVRLSASLQTGSKASLALELLADQSTFLDPPASELPTTPAPDNAAQQRLLDAAQIYVAQTLLHLPNFLATQTVKRFDNRGEGRTGLQLEETSSLEVSTRALAQKQIFLNRLTSWGEFGAAVGMVMNDTTHGTVTWSHWEQTQTGSTAVFHYSVPKLASHFKVVLPNNETSATTGPGGVLEFMGHPEAELQPTRSAAAYEPEFGAGAPGYSGSLWLDPATGTVLRITLDADPKDISPYKRAAMMVNYGPVRVDDSDYICPLRSLSSLKFKEGAIDDDSGAEPTQWLSETLFTGYHHFKSTARILSDAAAPQGEPTHDEGSQPSKPAQEIAASTQRAVAPVSAPKLPDNSNAANPATEQQFVAGPAASTQPPAQAYPAPLLRVSTNLIQIPVMVLSTSLEPLAAPIASNRFSISFNGGSPFQPKFVRREGDEPIQLAIFLDVRHPQEALLPKMDETIANLAPAFLHSRDHVSVYAVDCASIVAVEDVPAIPVQLKRAVDTALSRLTARQQLKQKSACVANARLWDLLAQVTTRLSTQSGWRAILAVTDGDPGKSKQTPHGLETLAAHDQVAIFALDPSLTEFDLLSITSPLNYYAPNSVTAIGSNLSTVCELTGGALLTPDTSSVAKRMQQVSQMLRDRYILEFPRSSKLIVGDNIISVRIDKSSALIRPAGDGVPSTDEAFMPDSAPVLADAPLGQPADNSNAAHPPAELQPVSEPAASTRQAATPVAGPQPETPPQTPPGVQAKASADTGLGMQLNAHADVSPTIRVNVNRVLVPVVVRDRQGSAVGDLKQEDFQIFDDNKLRVISAFTIQKRGIAEVSAASGPAGGAEPSAAPNSTPSAPAPPRSIVFLFDDRHLAFQDLAYAQKAAVKALDGALLGPSDRAVVLSTTGTANSGLTADRARLQQAIMAVKPQGFSRSTTGCIKIDDYQADLIVNKNDDAAFVDAVGQYMACNPATQGECGVSGQGQGPTNVHPDSPQMECLKKSEAGFGLMTAARDFLMQSVNTVVDTYTFIEGVVGKLATLPGQRTLILISSGFLNVDPEAQAMESHLIDSAALSNVTIDALDARGVYTTGMSASDNLSGAVAHNQYHSAAESQADAPMTNLADGTGGTFFHHSNDLDAGFKRMTEAPETVYLLELSLDGVKADGKFHRLKVKVRRNGVDVKARSEFFMPKPAKGK